MSPVVRKVSPNPDYTLSLVFENGEKRIFDVKPYLDKGIFRRLKDLKKFYSVRAGEDTIQWSGGQDLCPDTIYHDSVPVFDSPIRP